MILKALYDYYNRCNNLPANNMAYVNFYYAIVITKEGEFLRLEPLGDKEGIPLLTLRPEERTSSPIAHCMGDNGSYVLGLVNIDNSVDFQKELKSNSKNYDCFHKDIEDIHSNLPMNSTAKAVYLFYQNYGSETIKEMKKDAYWNELCKILKAKKNITFKINGEKSFAVCDKEILDYKIATRINNNPECICLISGEKGKSVDTTYSSFILKAKSNAKLVSFQTESGYDSYGKTKCGNAPISEDAEFKYTTALLHLLRKDSKNKFILGIRTFIFWASNNNEASLETEKSLFELLGFSEDVNDDPNANVMRVREVFKAIYSGSLQTSLDDKFYILGLAPNSARIAVVYWSDTTLKDFAEKILRHFNDMEIHDTRPNKKPYMGVWEILSAVALEGKVSNVTPNLPEAVIKSIFQGLPYPESLFQACIHRIRAEVSLEKKGKKINPVNILRAAIIKAYLNRQNNNDKKIEIMLDTENTNQGYLCGRLFAVLDKIQEDANNNSSIRERYMNAASATPASVFATIMNLSIHHSEKLNEGSRIFYEKLKQEILDKMPADGFPAHLDLQDQGRFFVGYYHQRQSLFTSKKEQE